MKRKYEYNVLSLSFSLSFSLRERARACLSLSPNEEDCLSDAGDALRGGEGVPPTLMALGGAAAREGVGRKRVDARVGRRQPRARDAREAELAGESQRGRVAPARVNTFVKARSLARSLL